MLLYVIRINIWIVIIIIIITIIIIIINTIITGKPFSLPPPTPTTCPNIKKHCVLWDKMHMSMIIPFILKRTA